jgi:polysaccharide biosynthesis transport protein
MTGVPEKEIHLLDYWRTLVKRRWVIYTSLAVVTSVATLGSLLMRPLYSATTRLQIEQSAPKVLPFQDMTATLPDLRNDFYQTQYGLIQSRRVAREVIETLRLGDLQEFDVGASAARSAGAAEGTAGAPAAGARPADDLLEGKRIDLFLKKLTVNPVRNSRLVDIAFSSRDPRLAARVANRVADTYIAFNSEAQYNTTERASTSLSHQVANLQDEIDAKEKELQSYAQKNEIVALGDKQNIALKTLNDLSNTYTQAQAIRIDREARYAALQNSSPEGLPEVMDSKLIQDLTAKSAELTRRRAELSGKYKPDWPEMVRLQREIDETRERLETERRSIYDQVLGAAEAGYRAAKTQESYLRTALESQKRQSQQSGLREIQYNNLRAEIANRRTTLEALVKRQSEASSSAGINDLVASNVRVVDVAEVPARPASPKILLNFVLSLVTGLGLGIGLAFFFEYLDKSVKTPEDMHQATGVPAVGLIPAFVLESGHLRVIRGNGADETSPIPMELMSHEDPKSKIAEAFRELRTALLVSQAGGPPRTILVTSTQPGEGKTAVSLNLAITLAQIGRRILLVDADLRKPRLHKLLGVPNAQGLSNYLSEAGVVWPEPQQTPIPLLDLIPSGPLPPNPADLLDSDRFVQLQREFQAQGYDHVVYDSPPVLAVSDAAIMSSRVEAVLIVVKAGVTSREALGHATKRLVQVKAKIVGSLLNRVDLLQQSYYGYTYRRYYGDEIGTPPPASRPRPDQTLQA